MARWALNQRRASEGRTRCALEVAARLGARGVAVGGFLQRRAATAATARASSWCGCRGRERASSWPCGPSPGRATNKFATTSSGRRLRGGQGLARRGRPHVPGPVPRRHQQARDARRGPRPQPPARPRAWRRPRGRGLQPREPALRCRRGLPARRRRGRRGLELPVGEDGVAGFVRAVSGPT